MSEASERVPFYREPLLHFVVAGGLLFAFNLAFVDRETDAVGPAAASPSKRIVLSTSHRTELADQWELRTGRPPSEADIERMVQQWIDREILYREAIAMGLHEDDTAVRNQVISKLTRAYQSLATVPEPSEDELRAYFDDHGERYTRPERYDIVHVFAPSREPDAQARVRAHLEAIEAGADPLELGPRFAKGRRFRLRTEANLVSVFGERFAAAVRAAEPESWTVVESRHGWHAVFVATVHPPTSARFAEVRERVRTDWERAKRQSDVHQQVLRLREAYEVELPDGSVLRASDLPDSGPGEPPGLDAGDPG